MSQKILVTGANGQIGTALVEALTAKYSEKAVIATDIRARENKSFKILLVDATQKQALESVIISNKVTQIYHLAAILSANGEKNPTATWDVNMKSVLNVLELAVENKVQKVFIPSSIAVFGNSAPKKHTPQNTVLDPTTVYGISKVAAEKWCNYYYEKFNLDIRSIRYPGVIGYTTMPGGGTTDYAVAIFYECIKNNFYSCYLDAKSTLPMIYIDEAIRATIELMEADAKKITVRTSYNLSGISFSPKEIFKEICNYYPNFKIEYNPDERQKIAQSWPESIDDSKAKKDWNWKPHFDLKQMCKIMIEGILKTHNS
jgi:threonine 3-dehydrogenase